METFKKVPKTESSKIGLFHNLGMFHHVTTIFLFYKIKLRSWYCQIKLNNCYFPFSRFYPLTKLTCQLFQYFKASVLYNYTWFLICPLNKYYWTCFISHQVLRDLRCFIWVIPFFYLSFIVKHPHIIFFFYIIYSIIDILCVWRTWPNLIKILLFQKSRLNVFSPVSRF